MVSTLPLFSAIETPHPQLSTSPTLDTALLHPPLHLKFQADILSDCTPKAVSHRLSNIRKGGTTHANGGAVASPTRTASTPKTPRSKAKATPRKKKDVSEDVDSDGPQGLMEDDDVLSPAAARGKRTLNGKRKPTYDETSDKEEEDLEVEDVYVPMAKRVKEEPVEDEGIIVEELVDEEV